MRLFIDSLIRQEVIKMKETILNIERNLYVLAEFFVKLTITAIIIPEMARISPAHQTGVFLLAVMFFWWSVRPIALRFIKEGW